MSVGPPVAGPLHSAAHSQLPKLRLTRGSLPAASYSNYSVEIDGSAWTLSGMIIRKLALAPATSSMTRSASPA